MFLISVHLGRFCHSQQKRSTLFKNMVFQLQGTREAGIAPRSNISTQGCTEILRGEPSSPEADALETNPRPDLQVEPGISILSFTCLLPNLDAKQGKREAWGVPPAHPAQEEEERPSSTQQRASGLSAVLRAVPFQLLRYLVTRG